VAAERTRALKEAAANLAEAQLMDTLYGKAQTSDDSTGPVWTVAGRKPVPGRKPLVDKPSKRMEMVEPYEQHGPVPEGFETDKVRALIASRVAARKAREYDEADRIQIFLRDEMGVRLDDRLRKWSVEEALADSKQAEKQARGKASEARKLSGQRRNNRKTAAHP